MFGLVSLILFIIVAVLGFLGNQLRKRQMRNALGRKVNEYDLNSINSWMQVAETEDRRSQK